MTTGTTYDFNLSSDEMVQAAFEQAGQQDVSTADLAKGIQLLRLLIREIDKTGKHLWALSTSNLTLSAQIWAYTNSNGLAANIVELETAYYRNLSGEDSPLDILRKEEYEAIPSKIESGDPTKVFLDRTLDISSRTLNIWPAPLTVETQSVVVGSDSNDYSCIKSHTSSSDNKPITGSNYLLFWEAGGSGSAWVTGTQYYNPKIIRYTFKRPLWDFDLATDNPDMPSSHTRYLMYRLAVDLAHYLEKSSSKIAELKREVRESYLDLYPSTIPKTNSYHNKGVFY